MKKVEWCTQHLFHPYARAQANPKFSDEVDRVLRRSNSEIIRHSLSKEIKEVCTGFPPTSWTG